MKLAQRLVRLADELLDAHDDTLRLSEDMPLGERWDAHLAYLRDLRRVGREALAAATGERGSQPSPALQSASARLRSCHAARRAGHLRPGFTRRGDRRCARNGHGEGSA
jgi:hypothetical protein